MGKITVVGSFVMDMIGLVDEFPNAGETIIGKKLETLPGGKGANQAVAAARLGADVRMIGMVGEDAFGDRFKEIFSEEKIDISRVLTSEKEPTALGLIQINNRGENKIVVIPGANYDYSIGDLEKVREEIKDSDLVMTQLELNLDVTYRLIDICHEENIPMILNPAPGVRLKDEYLKKIKYLTPNEIELEILTGIEVRDIESASRAITELLDIGVENVIATLGSQGALLGNFHGIFHYKAYEVDLVDTVGAGDSFNGALAYGIVNGQELSQAIKYANAVGALTVTGQGAIPSLPRKSQVDKFIEEEK